MFDIVQRTFGIVSVRQQNNIIEVVGVNGKNLYKDIKRVWQTSRVAQHMFIDIKRSSFTFHSFYLPDVLFTIETLLKRKSQYEGSRTLSKIRDALLEQTWLANVQNFKASSGSSKLKYDRLNDFYLTPKDFQSEFFEMYDELTQQYNLNGFLFAGAAGSGKTYSALALSYCLGVDKIVVICPKNAIHRVWEDTVKTKIKVPPQYYISSLGKPMTGKEKILIYHYEDLYKALEIADELRSTKFSIILDESHNFNEISSLRTNLFIELCHKSECKEVLWLSGTPIKALSKETIPLFRCIDPLFTPEVEESFKRIFRGDAGKAVEILNNRLGIVSFIVPKERLQLKDPIIIPIKIKIPNGKLYTLDHLKTEMSVFIEQRYEYWNKRSKDDKEFFYGILDNHRNRLNGNKAEILAYEEYRRALKRVTGTTMYAEVRDEIVLCNRYELKQIIPELLPEQRNKFKDVKSAIKYLPLKIKGECLGTVVGGARVKCFTELAANIDYEYFCETTEKKTIVFTSYVNALENAEAKCKEQDLKPTLVYGSTNKNLSSIIQKFEQDDNINPLIATFDSLSTAVPLVMCDVMVMINVPFRDYEMQQAISRIHRLGADTQTYVYTVFLDTGEQPNISTRSKDILEWSQKEVEKIIGIKSPFEINEENSIDNYNLAVEGYVVNENKNIAPSFMHW